MKHIKNITLIALLCMICFTFCGCATIGYVFVENENGSSTQYLSISLDKEYLTEQGRYEELKSDIEADFLAYGQQLWNEYSTNYMLIFGTLSQPQNSDLTWSAEWQDNVFSGEINYANATVINLTFGTNNEPVVWEKTEHTFTSTISTQTYTIFQGTDNMNFFRLYAEKYADIWDLEKAQLVYQYVSSTPRLHSDANIVTKIDREHYVHTWVIDGTEMNNPITLYYTQANASAWYILAFIITAVLGIIYVLIVLIVSKTKNIRLNKQQ